MEYVEFRTPSTPFAPWLDLAAGHDSREFRCIHEWRPRSRHSAFHDLTDRIKMKVSGSAGPGRLHLCRLISAMVMLIICAQTGSVRAQTSEPPPLHADIRAYAAADATGRDALIRRSRSHLIDRFRQLLRLAVSERAGVDDVSLPGDADTLATDFAARVERIHGFDVFAVDAATVLGLSDRSTTIRSRLHLGFFTKFHALRGSFRALGDTTSEARAQALAEPLRLIDAHLDRLALFARRHDDRDLQRFLVGIRPLVEGYRPDYGTHGWRLRKVAHAKAIATLLSEHGLEHDFRYFVAERNLAHAYLLEGQREKAGAALRAARGSVPWEELGLETKADLTSLELEFFKNRSYLEAARSAAKTLEDLLPRVEAAAGALLGRDRDHGDAMLLAVNILLFINV